MTPERYRRIQAVLADALDCAPAARSAHLRGACADDPRLFREGKSLVEHHSDEFLVTRDVASRIQVLLKALEPGRRLPGHERRHQVA